MAPRTRPPRGADPVATRIQRAQDATMLLLPCDPIDPRRRDEYFADEASAARELEIPLALVDHDALTRPGGTSAGVARVPASSSPAVYRGWMLRSEQYEAFERALAERRVTLRTSAQQYGEAHELPGWYPHLVTVTPRSVWTRGRAELDFATPAPVWGPGPRSCAMTRSR